ncbi:MAG: hypothetical protein MH204_06135 [Fimbriimonadaceae bacterium]|nr:hypothetical protein [Fimbriimonadaceae bacterium]
MISSLLALAIFSSESAAPPKVELRGDFQSGFRLLRNGQPFFVNGIGYGGGGPAGGLEAARAMGANAFRTWGADQLPDVLPQAQRHGFHVLAGLWLGHERHGFSYNDPAQLNRQREEVRQAVLRWKDHPSIFAWGLGNEMEGFDGGAHPRIWRHIEELAQMVKRLDPNRPVVTVVAEINPEKVKAMNELAPSIDIIGINSYGGAGSVSRRWREFGGRRPYMLTEFGPVGQWELPKNEWGVNTEFTSTEKAEQYRRHYKGGVADDPKLALGGFAFLWGWKQEVTHTWYAMRLKTGETVASADVMSEFWTGKKPEHLSPVITRFEAEGPVQVKVGGEVRVRLEASDPDGDPLTYEWKLYDEAVELKSGGDEEERRATRPGALVSGGSNGAVFTTRGLTPANYRIFLVIRDGRGKAATANLPIRVLP